MNLNLSNKDIKNSKIALLGDGLIGEGLNRYFEAIDWVALALNTSSSPGN